MTELEEQKIINIINNLSYIKSRIEGLDTDYLMMNNISFVDIESILNTSKLLEIEIEELKNLVYGEAAPHCNITQSGHLFFEGDSEVSPFGESFIFSEKVTATKKSKGKI